MESLNNFFCVDRTEFAMFKAGFLSVTTKWTEYSINRSRCRRAFDILRRGETVVFLSNNIPVSFAHIENDRIIEE